jgi:hypothetical protein
VHKVVVVQRRNPFQPEVRLRTTAGEHLFTTPCNHIDGDSQMSTLGLALALGLSLSSTSVLADNIFAPWSVPHHGQEASEASRLDSQQVVQTLGFAPWATAPTAAPRGTEAKRAVSATTIGFRPWS